MEEASPSHKKKTITDSLLQCRIIHSVSSLSTAQFSEKRKHQSRLLLLLLLLFVQRPAPICIYSTSITERSVCLFVFLNFSLSIESLTLFCVSQKITQGYFIVFIIFKKTKKTTQVIVFGQDSVNLIFILLIPKKKTNHIKHKQDEKK